MESARFSRDVRRGGGFVDRVLVEKPGVIAATAPSPSSMLSARPHPGATQRVVSAGFTEQDDLLALGVIPIAVTEWFGAEPFGVWPWAQSALGDAQPMMLNLNDGIQTEPIAALKPDLIVAINAGRDEDTYKKLSAIAPTVPQSGFARSSNRGRTRPPPSAKRCSRTTRCRP